MTKITERGMIFNGEMVRAILDGRKTQTRRPLKWKQTRFTEIGERDDGSRWPWSEDAEHACDFWHPCPFGAVGDRIWVRETFQGPLIPEEELSEFVGASNPDKFESPAYCEYAADGGPRPEYVDADDNTRHGWRPAIHMPRWASRILLEITDVRVERLQAITLGDICKEFGCGLYDFRPATYGFQAWEELWKSIYGDDSFQANPWIWVIEFKRIEGDVHATD